MKSTLNLFLFTAISSLIIFSCKKEEIEIPTIPEFVEPETSATYTLSFEGNWNLANHPTDYPTNAHFSKLAGIIHDKNVSLINTNRVASSGIQIMAETGDPSLLDLELRQEVTLGYALSYFVADEGLPTGVSTWSTEFNVNEQFHYLSAVSMLAPSPDWFVGASNIDLYDGNKFIEELVYNMVVYDADTDDGQSFASPDSVKWPSGFVFQLVDPPVGDGTIVSKPFARIVLTKK